MAKAKKPAADSAAPKPKAPSKKSAAKAKAPPPQPAAPRIDTNLAASTAARLVAHRDDVANVGADRQGESAAFKHLKQSLQKPAASSLPSFLQTNLPTKRINNAVPGRNQIGHNQTFGADVNRTGVPRRTGGG